MVQKAILFALLVGHTTLLTAQNLNYFGLFPVYNQNGNISGKFDYSIFLFGAVNTFNQTIEGTNYPPKVFILYGEGAVSYNFNKNFSASFAYVYERQNPFGSDFRNENRLYQQLTYKHFVGNSTIKQRLRFDERFVQNRATGEAPLSHRLRYLLGFETPISEKWYFSTYNEFFFSTSLPQDAFYSENWGYAGVGFKTKKWGNIEAGPIFITWVRNPAQERMNLWYLQIAWMTEINLSKAKNDDEN